MNIGDAAEQSGLPVKTVRYYDEIGLVSPARSDSGYRAYSTVDLHRLQFVARARSLGFSLDDCRHLLSLYDDETRASADVKRIVREKLVEVDKKIEELQGLRNTLTHLADNCRGDSRPDCPILADLAGSPTKNGSGAN
ncbi:Cu(I)-responsive transcriptional regulator [Granulosicoccus sp.]|nr:Cu(I)-responsive transcriptional regulator [Granulosicoccus sp.]MDB4222215.1 Cu(I)-responsive transcriptional regulator [Granulosicoccus sp.]